MPDPITPITLENAEGKKAVFMPQSDMTGMESALCSQLFVKMILNRSGQPLDWEGYLATHGLARHFVWEPNEETERQKAYRLELNKSAENIAERALMNALDKMNEPATKTIVATRDLPGVTKGTKMRVLADMPVLDGWVEEKGEEAA